MSLCLSCGLCCNGFIFKAFKVTDEELIPFTELLDETAYPRDKDGNTKLPMPCVQWTRESGCTIYNDRPKVCKAFKCKLLTKYEQGQVTMEEAIDKINFVRSQKIFRHNFKLKDDSIDNFIKTEFFG